MKEEKKQNKYLRARLSKAKAVFRKKSSEMVFGDIDIRRFMTFKTNTCPECGEFSADGGICQNCDPSFISAIDAQYETADKQGCLSADYWGQNPVFNFGENPHLQEKKMQKFTTASQEQAKTVDLRAVASDKNPMGCISLILQNAKKTPENAKALWQGIEETEHICALLDSQGFVFSGLTEESNDEASEAFQFCLDEGVMDEWIGKSVINGTVQVPKYRIKCDKNGRKMLQMILEESQETYPDLEDVFPEV